MLLIFFFSVEFTVGSEPIKNFRMIERHYFKDTLLKSFDFDFGFCIPNSTNTCEHIYHFPKLTKILSKFFPSKIRCVAMQRSFTCKPVCWPTVGSQWGCMIPHMWPSFVSRCIRVRDIAIAQKLVIRILASEATLHPKFWLDFKIGNATFSKNQLVVSK